MGSRSQERERLRAERLDAQRRAEQAGRRRVILGYVGAGLLAVAVVIGLVVAIASGGGDGDGAATSGVSSDSVNVNEDFGTLTEDVRVDDREGTAPPEIANGDLEGAANVAGCEVKLDLPDEGNQHFSDPDRLPDYKTNPPTSGAHYGNPNETGVGAFADGAFLDTPPLNRLVHSLEHGRVLIQYDPDLSEEEQLALKGVFDDDRPGVHLFPNPEMPYEVAVTSWTNLVGCESYEGAPTLDVVRAFRDSFRGRGPEPVVF